MHMAKRSQAPQADIGLAARGNCHAAGRRQERQPPLDEIEHQGADNGVEIIEQDRVRHVAVGKFAKQLGCRGGSGAGPGLGALPPRP
ncbi:hypothetical protein D9M71_530840 [compost metagenome]